MVQWLRLHAPTTGAQNPSLEGELRSCMPCDMAKKKDKQMHLGLKSLLMKKGEMMLTLLLGIEKKRVIWEMNQFRLLV